MTPAPPPEGVPWWAWMIVALAVVVAAPISGIVQTWLTRGLRKNVAKVVEQTENNHGQTPYPNMRDEITAVREAVETVVEGQRRHDGEIAGIRRDQGYAREDVGALRREHASTRSWVEAEAAERRHISTAVDRLQGSLDTHIVTAEGRDRQIAEIQTILRERTMPDSGPEPSDPGTLGTT